MRPPNSPNRITFGLFALVVLLGTVLFSTPARSASEREATVMSSPGDRGGTNVEDVRQLRFHDANRDSHVFEIEELPSWAGRDRGGALQISPVAGSTYATDTDYLLLHPKTGSLDLGGSGAIHVHGSPLKGPRTLRFYDAAGDDHAFVLGEIAREGTFQGMLRLRVKPGRTIFVADPQSGSIGFANDVAVSGHLGTMGIPVRLGEPLQAEGRPIRGLPEEPCDTCAVRADYYDADRDGVVDRAHSVRSLEASVGCESGQLCSETTQVTVPAGGTATVSFERTFTSGLPRIIQNETFTAGDESSHRVPALTIQDVQRRDDGSITGLVIRNGDADKAHTGTVGIQGVVE